MRAAVCAVLAGVLAFTTPSAQESGTALPPWTPGTLDIHHISTGLGNSTFARLPGGRTLLVDAGGAAPIPYADPKPDATRRPGQWIGDYVRTVGGVEAIDHAVLTHFHPDHIGGLADVAATIPIRKIIDRGAPAYAYLRPADTDTVFKAYRDFLASNPTIVVEGAAVGSTAQIADASGGGDRATIRVVAANDRVWTGKGDDSRVRFPALDTIKDAADRPTENMSSVALRISYGAFDYFTGGDMPGYPVPGGPEWHDLESDVARAIGQTDARQVGHHGSIEVENPFFLATTRSRVLVLPAWSPTHPSADVLKRMLSTRIYPDPRDIFVVQFREPTKAAIGARASQVASASGHVVIRVEPGGARYRVFVLDNDNTARRITALKGPYEAVR
jgi:glyoxylase-like metal-dependent hydrolase (beta-lactamase superfamily II)